MQSKDIIASIGQDLAIITPQRHVHQSYYKPENTQRQHVIKVRLVNTNRYVGNGAVGNDLTNGRFQTAPPADKSYGYLVSDGTMYRVVRPKEFIGVWSRFESRWADEAKAEAKEQAMREAREAVRARARGVLEENLNNMTTSITQSVERLVGKSDEYFTIYANVRDDYSYDPVTGEPTYRGSINGHVRISIEGFMNLIELVLEAENE